MIFSAHIIDGDGRGQSLGSPTLNLDVTSKSIDIEEGVYACFAWIDESEKKEQAVLHFGARPTFDRPISCEVHLLDKEVQNVSMVKVEIVEQLRSVQKFEDAEALKAQIADDITQARGILAACSEN